MSKIKQASDKVWSEFERVMDTFNEVMDETFGRDKLVTPPTTTIRIRLTPEQLISLLLGSRSELQFRVEVDEKDLLIQLERKEL